MYDEKTPQSIKAAILQEVTGDLDCREGSFTDDVIGPIALEMSKVYSSLEQILPIVYLEEGSGEYIDRQCAWYGIARKQGAKAGAQVVVKGASGSLLPPKTIFLTGEGLEFSLLEGTVILGEGQVTVEVQATQSGNRYNVGPGEICRQSVSLPGVESVQNPMAAMGGTDAEGDKALLERLQEYRSRPATSGNISHYRQWALAVEGVGDARIYPLKHGAGTVEVLIVGMDGLPVDNHIVELCKSHMEVERPIGAQVNVKSARAVAVGLSATVTLEEGIALSGVVAAYREKVEEYLRSIRFRRSEVPVNRMAYILLDIPGVLDCSNLTLNGSAQNLRLQEDEVPVVGEVALG